LQSSKQFDNSHPELSVKRCFEEIRVKLTETSVDSLVHFPSYDSASSILKRFRSETRPKIPVDFATLPATLPAFYQEASGTRTPCLDDCVIPSFLYMDLEYYADHCKAHTWFYDF